MRRACHHDFQGLPPQGSDLSASWLGYLSGQNQSRQSRVVMEDCLEYWKGKFYADSSGWGLMGAKDFPSQVCLDPCKIALEFPFKYALHTGKDSSN